MIPVLIVEDNIDTQILLKRFLSEHYNLTFASTLQEAWQLIEKGSFDIIILDRSLPDGDGINLCTKIRERKLDESSYIIMLTAHDQLDEKIHGLSAGADDYLVKPFEPRELIARIEALKRRKTSLESKTSIKLGDLRIEVHSQTVRIEKPYTNAEVLELTPIEYKVLLALAQNFDRPLDRVFLAQHVWRNINLSERNIDTHICHLRKKLASSGLTIRSRRNEGYYLTQQRVIKAPPAEVFPILPAARGL